MAADSRTDHYAVLGVLPDADRNELRAAYLRVMRACHPDVRPHDPGAAERARLANLAWQVLREPGRRAAYDRQIRARAAREAAPPPPDAPGQVGQAAYVAQRKAYGQAFHRACLKGAAAVFALGLLLLALTAS